MKNKVLSRKQFPISVIGLVERSFIIYIALDKFNADIITSTVVYTLWGLVIILSIIMLSNQEETKIKL